MHESGPGSNHTCTRSLCCPDQRACNNTCQVSRPMPAANPKGRLAASPFHSAFGLLKSDTFLCSEHAAVDRQDLNFSRQDPSYEGACKSCRPGPGLLAKMIVSKRHWLPRMLGPRRKPVLPCAGVPASRLLCTLHEKESANLLHEACKHSRVKRFLESFNTANDIRFIAMSARFEAIEANPRSGDTASNNDDAEWSRRLF